MMKTTYDDFVSLRSLDDDPWMALLLMYLKVRISFDFDVTSYSCSMLGFDMISKSVDLCLL